MNVNHYKLLEIVLADNKLEYGTYNIVNRNHTECYGTLYYSECCIDIYCKHMFECDVVFSLLEGDYDLEKKGDAYYYFDDNLRVCKKVDKNDELDKANKSDHNYFSATEYTNEDIDAQFRKHITNMRLNLLANFCATPSEERMNKKPVPGPSSLLAEKFLLFE